MAKKPAKTDRITVRLPLSMIQSMDALIGLEQHRNRTDVVYNALKDFLHSRGSMAEEMVESERGMLKLKEMAAEMDAMKARMAKFLE